MTADRREPPELSPFTLELVAELQAAGGSWAAWRRFFARSWDKSIEQMWEAPRRVRACAGWLVALGGIGAGLLALCLGTGEVASPGVLVVLWCAWFVGVAAYLLLHLGLVRGMDGAPHTGFLIPNGLSSLRLTLAPLWAWPLLDLGAAPFELRAVVLGTLVTLVASDALDGFWARRFSATSDMGRTLDPLADLVLISALAIGLYRAQVLPLAVLGLVLLRYPGALVGAVVLYLARRPAHITATPLGKVTTALTFALLSLAAATVLLVPEWPVARGSIALRIALWGLGCAQAVSLVDLALRARRWPAPAREDSP